MIWRVFNVKRLAAHRHGASDAEPRIEANLLIVDGDKRAQLALFPVESKHANQIGADQLFDFLFEQIHQRRELSLRVHPSNDR